MVKNTTRKRFSSMEPTTSEYIIVKESSIHNKGIFAAKDIPKGAKILEYVGEKITKRESDRRADEVLARAAKDPSSGAVYIFTLNRWHDIDGDVPYNTAKYINHSCSPNCEVIQEKDDSLWIVAERDIKKGEELSYNYGYEFDAYEDHPCKCGSPNCVGYILDERHWKKLRAKYAEKV